MSDTYREYERAYDKQGLRRWIKTKKDEMKIHERETKQLIKYIDSVEKSREKVLANARQERRET